MIDTALLVEATDIITDLLLAGAHEGECTNINTPDVSCELHLAAYEFRLKRAESFLAVIANLQGLPRVRRVMEPE